MSGASFRSSSTSSRQGRRAEPGGERRELGRRLLLQVEAVAPELGRARHDGVLEVQPAGELLLADGEGVGIGGRLDLVAKRGAEALEALERLAAGGPQLVGEPRRLGAHRDGQLHDELAAATQHRERGLDEHRGRLVQRLARGVEEGRDRAEPLERRGRPRAGVAARSAPAPRTAPGRDG